MALQESGQISLEDIRGEFNDLRPGGDFLSEYYSVASGIPRKGQEISLSDFYGKVNLQMSVVYENTDPTLELVAAVTGREYEPSVFVTITPTTAAEFSYTQVGSENRADGTTLPRWYKNYGTGSQTGPFYQRTVNGLAKIQLSSAPIETTVSDYLNVGNAGDFGYTLQGSTESSTGITYQRYNQTGGFSTFPSSIWRNANTDQMYEQDQSTRIIEGSPITVTSSNFSSTSWYSHQGQLKYVKSSPAVIDPNNYYQYFSRGTNQYYWAQNGGYALKTRHESSSVVDVTTSNASQMGYSLNGAVENGYTKWTKAGQTYWAGSDNRLYTRTETPRTVIQDDTYTWNGYAYSSPGSENLYVRTSINTYTDVEDLGETGSIVYPSTLYIGRSLYISYLLKYKNWFNLVNSKTVIVNPTVIPETGLYWEVKSTNTLAYYGGRASEENSRNVWNWSVFNDNFTASFQRFRSERLTINGVYYSTLERSIHYDIGIKFKPNTVNSNANFGEINFFIKDDSGFIQADIGIVKGFYTGHIYNFSTDWTLHNKYETNDPLFSYTQKRDTLVTYTYPDTITDTQAVSQLVYSYPFRVNLTRTDTSYTYGDIQEVRPEVLAITDTPSFDYDDARERLYRVSTTSDSYPTVDAMPAATATGYNWRSGRTVQNYFLQRIEIIDGAITPTAIKTLQVTSGTPVSAGESTPQRLVFAANAEADPAELTDYFYNLYRSDANVYNAVNLNYVAPMGGSYPTLSLSGSTLTLAGLDSNETYQLKWFGYQGTTLSVANAASAATGTSNTFSAAPTLVLAGGDDGRRGMDFFLEREVHTDTWAVVRCFEFFQDTNQANLFGSNDHQIASCDFLDHFATGRTN